MGRKIKQQNVKKGNYAGIFIKLIKFKPHFRLFGMAQNLYKRISFLSLRPFSFLH
jgi:hypothetical protein